MFVPKLRAALAVLLGSMLVVGTQTAPAHADVVIPFKVNFQTSSTVTPAGYSADTGMGFDATRGFGWETLGATPAPLNFTANARERNVLSDKRLDTLVHFVSSTGTQGQWEALVPNGTYDLTVAVGDPSYINSHHVIRAEGNVVVDFTPTSAAPNSTVTRSVTISDGRLTIDQGIGTANPGNNTKINYLELAASAPPPPPPTGLVITSPEDNLQLGTRMVFSTVRNISRPGHNFTIQNPGTSAVNVTGFAFGGTNPTHFRLCTGQTSSFSIPAGGSASVCVMYRPTVDATTTTGGYTSAATLNVQSAASSNTITLGGLNARNYESVNEPNLQLIATALGYNTNIPVLNRPQQLSISPASTAVGDEVVSAYWRKLDPAKPVTLLPAAWYSGRSTANSPSFGLFPKGSSYVGRYQFLAGPENDGYGSNQALLPRTTNNSYDFSTLNGSFAYGDSSGNRSDDNLVPNGRWHNTRFFQVKNAAGAVIPGVYLVGSEIGAPQNNGAKNWDYQDYVHVLINAQPDGGNDQPLPGELSRTLDFAGAGGGVANTGFHSTQGTFNSGQVSLASGRLRVLTNADTNTSHANALQLRTNAGTNFRVQSRFVGPFDFINAGAEQQAIFFGPDASNYLKVELDWNASTSQRMLTIWKQVGATGSIVGRVPLPGGNANTLDLRIDVTPSSYNNASGAVPPHAGVFYALNGSTTFTKLNATVAQGNVPAGNVSLPNNWITTNTPAGIFQSHQEGGTQFTAVYENFVVTRRY